MKQLIALISLCLLMGGTASANCADSLCTVDSGSGQKFYFMNSSCGFRTQPSVELTDSDGNLLKNAQGQVTVLPSNSGVTELPRVDATYILGGFWYEKDTSKLKFVGDDGSEVFNLRLTITETGSVGQLTSNIPGLTVRNADVTCKN